MYLVYHKSSTKIAGTYANERAAKAGLTRMVDRGVNRAEYGIVESGIFHSSIEKLEIRHGVGPAHGKQYTVGANTPWYSGPWSEAYWQN